MKAIMEKITQLPPEGQLEVLDFVVFLQSRYETKRPVEKKGSILDEPFVGMWEDREDMKDSLAWVRNLRRKEWARR